MQTKSAHPVQFLNAKEITWLQHYPTPLTVGITQIPNQVLKDKKGNYRGYAVDIFKKLESLLRTTFRYVYYDTWEDVLNAGEKREIDIIFLAQKTEKRLKLYNFTDVVLLQSNKIITTYKHHTGTEVDDLYGQKVVVVKDSAIAEYIKLNFPKISLLYSESETRSLDMLLKGIADYTIAEPVRMSYYIKQNNIDNLYIAGTFPYNYKLRIATRNDRPIINIILNKALEQISPAEQKALALKWGYEKEMFLDKELLLKIATAGVVILLFLLYLTLLNRKLKRTKDALSELNRTLEERVAVEVEKNREKELMMLHQSRFAQMGQILNMIAHQWRQPLHNLMSINQVLVVKYDRKNGNLSKKDIVEFDESSSRQIQLMSKTIDDFRDFFKPRRDKQVFMVNEILIHILEIIHPVFDAKNIELNLKQTKKLFVEGYPNELAQAILNILYNAKDAFEEKNISSAKAEMILLEKESSIILILQDNAGGIDMSIMKKIFDPYFSTKEKKNGTGIGLYVSKMIIEKHMGGKLYVENFGDGARFIIELNKASDNNV